MTDNQKKTIVVLNRLHNTYGFDEKPVLTDEEYFMLLEFIINKHETQYVPWPIENPLQPAPCQKLPWMTEPYYENPSWYCTTTTTNTLKKKNIHE